ncbi:hypothetical protein [Phenylobacterium sp.]|uniref:hypothetical protein n=1 Tax=Phenylobacterium sp. TaxID=1871053 RepID=UPI0025E294C7|nr:hypothetical protein [Phenylobacterium sp.]
MAVSPTLHFASIGRALGLDKSSLEPAMPDADPLSGLSVRLAVGLALAALAPPAFAADPPPLCSAFRDLARTVERTGQTRHVSLRVNQNAEAFTSCSVEPDDLPQRAYCAAALDTAGIEMAHRYPWVLIACLQVEGARFVIDARSGDTGILRNKQKVVRLTAKLRRGIELNLRFEPDRRPDAKPTDDNYFGAYDLTLSRTERR